MKGFWKKISFALFLQSGLFALGDTNQNAIKPPEAMPAKPILPTGDSSSSTNTGYYSPSSGLWTNIPGLFKLAISLRDRPGRGTLDFSRGNQLITELGNASYIPAELALGGAGLTNQDLEGVLGVRIVDSGMVGTKHYDDLVSLNDQTATRHFGVSPFLARSAYWYRKAANQGSLIGQRALGEYYSRADGPLDLREAIMWFGKAAAQGDRVSQLKLADYYMSGRAGFFDIGKGLEMYEQAEAFYEMTNYFLKQKPNKISAYMWWMVGKARENRLEMFQDGRITPPFSSDHASIMFTAPERELGAQRANAYLMQRYHTTNSIAPMRTNPRRNDRSN